MSVQLSSLSPRSYKREVATLETSVDNFKSQIQRLIDTFKQFSNTGSLRDGVFLSDTVLEFGGSQNSGSRECEVMTIGETVKFLETSRRQLLENVQGIFVRPLEEFLHTDINDIQVMKQRVAESKEEFNQAKLRFEAARSSGKPTSKSNKELEEAKKAFKVAEITYSNKLIDIMSRKEFEVVEKLCSYMFAQANFFHEGYEALSKLEPTMRQMMNTLVNAQNDYLVGKNQFNIEDMLNKQKDDWGSPMIDLQLKQGYIFLKKKSSWIRRWLVVTDGLLYIYKGWKDLEPINTINLLLCTVKVMTSERSHCLALISPEIQMTFQAMGQDDMIEWKAVIEAGIGLQLTKKKNTNTKNQAEMTTSEEKFAYLQELREIETNRVCADCNQPDPEWGLMNLGVLICYECSGVHRSLGVHISKVRSLTLDAWNDELFYIIKTCGNEKGNKIYEHNIQGLNKLNPSSDRKAREEYIRAKYDEKKFVEKPQLPLPQLQLDMLERCNEGDLYSVMKLIAQGVDVNFKVNPDLKQSLLHQVTIDGKATTYILELLIQNGAQVFSMDSTGKTPLHFASRFDRVTYARMLCLRGASENAEDKEQQTPLSIATSIPNSKVYKYFKKEITNEELAGLQPADLESLQIIKSNFVGGVDLIKGKLEELRKQLKDAESVETTLEILKKIRAIKLAICFDS